MSACPPACATIDTHLGPMYRPTAED